MITFIKDYTPSALKDKFILLYIINILDIILSSSMYLDSLSPRTISFESNTLSMVLIIMAIRFVIPGVLLYFCNYRIQQATQDQLKKSNILLNLTVIVFILVSNINSFKSLL